jgi:hypothetical protein
LANENNNFAVVRYHWFYPSSNDPFYAYNISENIARNNYYNNGYSPHMVFDGNVDGGSIPETWQAIINAERYVYSPANMELWGYYNPDSLSGSLHIRIITESNPGQSNIKLRIALIESDIHITGPNGTPVHNQVLRDMIPSAGGQSVTLIAHDSLEYSFAFGAGTPMIDDNCELIAFLQSDQYKSVIQAAKLAISDLTPTGIDNNSVIPASFSVAQNYPNPFNARTIIDFSLPKAGNVTVNIYSIAGQLVETLGGYFEAGNQSVAWDASRVSSGVYFYKLTSGDHSQIMKMTLLK